MAFIVSLFLLTIIIISTVSMRGNTTYGDLAKPRTIHGEPIIHDHSLEPETIFRGEGFFTSMAFVGPNDILVLDKNSGRVHKIVNGRFLDEPLLDVKVANTNERGMLGIAVAKNSDKDSHSLGEDGKDQKTYVFLLYSASKAEDEEAHDKQEDLLGNRLYRYELDRDKLTNPRLLLKLKPDPRTVHNGGTTVIGPDNNVYVVTGEAGNSKTLSRNIKDGLNPFGSSGILRLTQDGRPLVDINGTGILGNTYPLTMYYAYGIRNSFGMDFDPVTGNLWDTENGPASYDETNLVRPGFNSGWQTVMGPISLSGDTEEDLVNFPGSHYADPLFSWAEPPAVTDIEFLDSSNLGDRYANNIFVGDINNGNLYFFGINENRNAIQLDAAQQESGLSDLVVDNGEELSAITFGSGFGGITDIETGPDGFLYVLSDRKST